MRRHTWTKVYHGIVTGARLLASSALLNEILEFVSLDELAVGCIHAGDHR